MVLANSRVILISGGARGIGAAIAARLATSNHKMDTSPNPLAQRRAI